jgi:zinc protease
MHNNNNKKVINIKQFSIFNIILYGTILGALVLSYPFLFTNYEKKNINSISYIDNIISNIKPLDFNNNSKVVFYENKDSNVISINLMFKGGSAIDSLGYEGISAILANAMLNGAGGLSIEDFNKLIDANAIKISIDAKRDYIVVNFSTLNEYSNQAFDVLDMVLNSPNLDNKALEIAKTEILTQINFIKSDPKTEIYKSLYDNLYPKNSYYRSILGNPKAIVNIQSTMLKKFKNQVITQDNLYIAVSGNISQPNLFKKLKNIIQKLPKYGDDDFNLAVIKPKIENKTIVINNPKITQADIVIVLEAPIYNTNNYYYATILNAYLGQLPDSILFDRLRNKKGLVYNVSSSIYKDSMSTFWTISLSTSPDKVDDAISSIKEILLELKNNKYNFKDIQVAKNWILNYQLNYFGNNHSIANYLNSSQFYNASLKDSSARYNIIQNVQNSNIDKLIDTIDFSKMLIIKTLP